MSPMRLPWTDPMDLATAGRSMATGSIGVAALSLAVGVAFLTGSRAAVAQEVGEVFQDCEVCPQMIVVPGGRFGMGSPETEEGRDDDEGPRRVVAVESFAVGVYEVTFEEWDACAFGDGCGGALPEDAGWGRGDHPVINVSWEDAQAYAEWLSETTGQEYRLLTESEWEYVARAGTQTARYWGETASGQCRFANGDDEAAPCSDGYENPAPVGSFEPNTFGLYDILGNVWEWVEDCYGDYEEAPRDGSASHAGDCDWRVFRGGGWNQGPDDLRAAARTQSPIGLQGRSLGFRVARTVN